MMPVRPAPRVMFASPWIGAGQRFAAIDGGMQGDDDAPRGWPSFASPAALTNIGRVDLIPRMVVEGST